MDFIQDLSKPQRDEIERLLLFLKNAVTDGRYVILPRPENEEFFADFNLKAKFIIPEVISTLTIYDFCKCEYSNNQNHIDEIVYFFRSEKELTDITDDYTEMIEIYIKFTCKDPEGIIFISFHDAKEDMYPYKWSVSL